MPLNWISEKCHFKGKMVDHFETPGTGKTIDVPLTLMPGTIEPLTVQLTRQLRTAILEGQLAHGTRLPSTRTLGPSPGGSARNGDGRL